MNVEQMTNFELATTYMAITEKCLELGLITGGYKQNAEALSRHVGRQVMKVVAAEIKGEE